MAFYQRDSAQSNTFLLSVDAPLPVEAIQVLADWQIAVRHAICGGACDEGKPNFIEREQSQISIFGHTHQPKAEWFCKALLSNPSSAGLSPWLT